MSQIAEIEAELVKRGEIVAEYTVSAVMFAAFGIGVAIAGAMFGGFPAAIGVLIAIIGGAFAVGALINTWETNKLKKERSRLMDENPWTKDSNELKKDLEKC